MGVSIWLSFTLHVLNMHTQLLNCICVHSHMVIPSEARLESGSIESRGGCSTLSTIRCSVYTLYRSALENNYVTFCGVWTV